MNTPEFKDVIKFKVQGQRALPKWMQTALSDALEKADAPPESLRFQCRIATDAKENLREVKLRNGETLSLHPQSHPQFGKNHRGQPFLTASMTYSGDGQTYTFRWLGDAVPTMMQAVAVKHDQGKAVGATTIGLDLSAATVAPAWKFHGKGPVRSRTEEQKARRRERIQAGEVKPKRHCARITDADLVSA